MRKLYRFYYDYSDYADFISGMFIENEEVVKKALGKTLLFQFGPHEEDSVELIFEECYLDEIDISPEALKELDEKFNDYICGHNPLDYIIY